MFSIGRIRHGFIRGYFGTTSKLAALAHARECFGILQSNHYWRPISYRNRPSWLDQQAGLACATPLRQFDFRFTDDWNEAVGRVEWGTLGRDLIIPVFATLRPPIQITPSFATLTLWVVFPKWRVVSWRTRVREARMMRLCTRVYTHEGSATKKWGTAPHEEWDPCKEPQNFKEESTENQFPWPLYPFPIIECWWWCVPGPKSPFCFVEIGFRDLRWNLIKTLIHCTSLLSHIPYPNSSGTFISWTASYRPVTTIIVRIGFREFDQV